MDQLSRLTGMSSPNDRGKRNDSKQLSFHLKLLLLNGCTKIYGPLNSIKEKVFYRVWLRFKFTFYNFKWTKNNWFDIHFIDIRVGSYIAAQAQDCSDYTTH